MKKMILSLAITLCGLLLAAAEIGAPAPALESGPMLKGERLDLSKLKDKKVVVLHFWKTQCPACRQSVEMLNEMAAKYRMKAGFMAIGTELPEVLKKEPEWKLFSCSVMSDALHRNEGAYLPQKHTLPMDAVIDRDGALLWVGPTVQLAAVLQDVTEGKFDRARAVETDQFNRAMRSAMQKKDYNRALEILHAREKKYPDDLDMIIGEANILAVSLKQPEKALELLDRTLANHPKAYNLYSAKLKILQSQSTNPHDRKMAEVYQAIARNFSDRPMMLVKLSGSLMQEPAGTADLLNVYILAEAAYRSKMLKSATEKGMAASALARSCYYVGLTERAVVLQSEAVTLLKGSREYARAAADLGFYRNAVSAAQEIRKMESKK